MLSAFKIISLHICVCIVVFILSAGLCGLWYRVVSTPGKIEEEFRHSETLQLLQIIIGFTYVNVIQSFFASLQEKTALIAELRAIYDDDSDRLSDNFLNKLIGLDMGGSDDNADEKKDSWSHWKRIYGVPDKYKAIFSRVVVADNSDHGQLFSMLGPWLAIAVFYFFHPPVAYREDGSLTAWVLIYSFSICILFSFLVTMWIVERGAVKIGVFFGKDASLYSWTLHSHMEEKTRHMRSQSGRTERTERSGRSGRSNLLPYAQKYTPVRRSDILL